MKAADLKLTVTYDLIADRFLLVHFSKSWMLLDLAEISSQTGKSYAEIIQKLCG